MASLWKHPKSSKWTACYTLPNGKRVKKSTGLPATKKNEKKAHDLARALEIAAAKRGGVTEAQARELAGHLYGLMNPEPLASQTVALFLEQWLIRKKVETKRGTYSKYASVAAQFLTFLGERSQSDISTISAAVVTGFRNDLAERLSIGSANIALKIVKMVFKDAVRDSMITVNVAADVKTLKKSTDRGERRPFTVEELRRIFASADGEWKGLLLAGLYTAGQRLGDIARLTWQNVDLPRAEIRFLTRKTGRRQILPIPAPLMAWLESLPSTDNPKDAVFPGAFALLKASKNEHTGALSNAFHELLVQAGLAEARTHQRSGAGRSSRRKMSELSFHSLRHTATSLMKNAGISGAIVQDIVGHESAAISANYTHIEESSKRLALAALPDITTPER